ncbi:hypothetical protein Tco_1368869 [Tanacetum coccineum]
MPRLTASDQKNTRDYIPTISNEYNQPLKNDFEIIENRYIPEGQVVDPDYDDMVYLNTMFGMIDFDCLLKIILQLKIKTAERVSTVRERIKTEERIKIVWRSSYLRDKYRSLMGYVVYDLISVIHSFKLKEFDLLKWDPTRGILQLGQQVVSELVALRNFARRYGSRFCTHGGCIQSSHAQTGELEKKLEIAQKEKDRIQFNVDKFENASKSLNKLIESQIVENVVPLPYTGNFMPPTPDLSFTGLDDFVNKPVVENRKSDEEVFKVVRKSNDSLIIEDWVSDSEEENVSQTKTKKKTVKPRIAKIEFVKTKQQEKTARKTIKQVEKHRQNTHSPRGNQRNWNNMMSQRLGSNFEMFKKACYMCGSFDHLQVDCNYHHKQFQKQRMVKPVWNNAQMVNHQNFAKKTHSCAKKNMVPRAVLMKSGLVSINTARQVNAAHTKTTVNAARPMSYLSKKAHSTVKRPIHKNTAFKNSNFNQRVNIVKDKNVNIVRPKAVVNAVKGNNVNAIKASACWVWKPKTKVLDHGNPQMDLQDQGVIDSGCSRHMTGNMSYLIDYEEIDGGYVAFGGNPKGGKITGKDTIKTGSGLDWLFDIDALKRSMNYELIVDDRSKPLIDDEKKVDEDPRKDSECNDQEKKDNVNNTNNVNAASTNEVNVVGGKQ